MADTITTETRARRYNQHDLERHVHFCMRGYMAKWGGYACLLSAAWSGVVYLSDASSDNVTILVTAYAGAAVIALGCGGLMAAGWPQASAIYRREYLDVLSSSPEYKRVMETKSAQEAPKLGLLVPTPEEGKEIPLTVPKPRDCKQWLKAAARGTTTLSAGNARKWAAIDKDGHDTLKAAFLAAGVANRGRGDGIVFTEEMEETIKEW